QQDEADLASTRSNSRAAETALNLVRNRLRILGKTDAEISAFESAQRIDPIAFVVAPIGGTVTDRQGGLGQYIQAGSPNPVYVIGNLPTVWLIAPLRQAGTPPTPGRRLGGGARLALPGAGFKAEISLLPA